VRYRSAFLFLVLSAVWGTAFVAIKTGLAHFPPVLFAALRYDVAGVLVLGCAAVVTDSPRPHGRRQWAAVGVGAVLLIAGYHVFLFVGVGVLVRPTPARLLGGDLVPELLVFLAALSFALGSVLTRRLEAAIPIETMEAWAMLGGALLMHGVSLGLGESPDTVAWTPPAVAALGYLAAVASAAGVLIYFDPLDRLGPIEINLVSYAAPVFAAAGGVVLLGETVGPATVAGFLLIVFGFGVPKRDALRATVVKRVRRGRCSLVAGRAARQQGGHVQGQQEDERERLRLRTEPRREQRDVQEREHDCGPEGRLFHWGDDHVHERAVADVRGDRREVGDGGT